MMVLGQEIKIRGLHLSNHIQGAWNKFTVDMALPNGRFEHYMKMDPHQLKKNFKIMLTNSATRTARGKSAGYETHKFITPLDGLFCKMADEIDEKARQVARGKEKAAEINSSKLHMEREVMGSSDSEDDPIYHVPNRTVSMLQRKGDGNNKVTETLVDEDEVNADITESYVDEDGFTSITLGNKPQNGKYTYLYFTTN